MIFWLICLNSAKSQWTWIHFAETSNTGSIISQYDNTTFNYHYLGIGFPSASLGHPNANFHILEPISIYPLFRVQATGIGSVTNWFDTLGAHYGFYESSISGQQVLNYFQDPVFFGNMQISNNRAYKTIFFSRTTFDTIDFHLGPGNPGNNIIPLTITANEIRVRTKLVTDSFRLVTNPGIGYLLLSDAHGNGLWTDPSTFNDKKWSINSDGDLYANPDRIKVGIGFQSSSDKVYQRLHVIDGNILISRSPIQKSAPSSKNGSILFADTVTENNTLGEWGIEYSTNNRDYTANGLNFWKPFSSGSGGGNYYLYLRNDGNVGVGTKSPGDKFQVNDSISKVDIGAGPDFLNSSKGKSSKVASLLGNGYIGFNAAYSNTNGWLVSGNGSSNAGGLIYNSTEGDMYFSTIPNLSGSDNWYTQSAIELYTKMRICQLGGVIIGQDLVDNTGTTATLEVRNEGPTNILINALDHNSVPGFAGISIKNTLNGAIWGVNNTGVFHLYEGVTQLPILSFHNGKVGVGNVNLDLYSADHKLFVEKGITTEEVTVKVKGDWSDYVFDQNYKLKSISELARYIETNKHLPEVPTSSEVKKDGIEMGRMNTLLLKKIEELTLYVIDLNQKIDSLENKIQK